MKRAGEEEKNVFLPESLNGASGAIKISKAEDSKRSKTKVENKGCKCWLNSLYNWSWILHLYE